MAAEINDSPWKRARPGFLQHEDFIWFSAQCPADYFLMVIDRSLIIRYINHVHRHMEIEKVLGSSYLDYISEADRGPVQQLLNPVFTKRETVVFETSFTGSENRYVGYRTRIQPLQLDGHVPWAIVMAVEIAKLDGEMPAGETLTVCAWTNRVKLGTEWVPLDDYLKRKYGLKISHGISPEAHRMMAEGVFDENPGNVPGVEAAKSRLRRTARVFLDKPASVPGSTQSLTG